MKTIAFFNNKGGVGKTSLVYHLAWMYGDRGIKVLVADLDPQANLSAMFLDNDRLLELWDNDKKETIADSLQPLMDRTGDIAPPHVERVNKNIGLVPGNLALSRFEDLLSENWPKCLAGEIAAFRVITAFYRIIQQAAQQMDAGLILIDVGPNLGAINRAALIAAEQVVLPLAPDLFSLQGLRNLGPTLRDWRKNWHKRLLELPQNSGIAAPSGDMKALGYVVMQHGVRDNRPVKAYQRWLEQIPAIYREAVLDKPKANPPSVEKDNYKLALLKHYRSLMPLAMEAHKPMFALKSADGAIGAHIEAVHDCYDDFLNLAKRIAKISGFAVN
jgi:cellulose biosynthesis protein BcsQ